MFSKLFRAVGVFLFVVLLSSSFVVMAVAIFSKTDQKSAIAVMLFILSPAIISVGLGFSITFLLFNGIHPLALAFSMLGCSFLALLGLKGEDFAIYYLISAVDGLLVFWPTRFIFNGKELQKKKVALPPAVVALIHNPPPEK